MKLSSGLRTYVVGTGSFKGALDGCLIRMYSGTAPTAADAAIPVGSDMLCEVSVGDTGTGVTFEVNGSVAGTLLKTPAEVWRGTVATSGLATWFRMVKTNDVGDLSTTAVRLQGTIQYAGGDMQITDPNLLIGADQKVDYFSVVMPTE